MFLLVGAPKANTTQPGIVEGGQVLKCDWASPRRCQPIEFDATGKCRCRAPGHALPVDFLRILIFESACFNLTVKF